MLVLTLLWSHQEIRSLGILPMVLQKQVILLAVFNKYLTFRCWRYGKLAIRKVDFTEKNGSKKHFLYQCSFHFHLIRICIVVNNNFGICSNKSPYFIYLFNKMGGDCFARDINNWLNSVDTFLTRFYVGINNSYRRVWNPYATLIRIVIRM